MSRVSQTGREAARALLALALPPVCALCARVTGGAALCPGCAAAFAACLDPGGPHPTRPDPVPPGMPPTLAAGTAHGALRAAVTAYKDRGRRDVGPVLATPLRRVLAHALARDPVARERLHRGGEVLLVPVPGSKAARRRRGDAPVPALVRGAGEGLAARLVTAEAVVLTRRTADQSHLGTRERAANLDQAMCVPTAWHGRVRGAVCLVADDVVTTGASLVETSRALRAAGAGHIVAVALAATPRRSTCDRSAGRLAS